MNSVRCHQFARHALYLTLCVAGLELLTNVGAKPTLNFSLTQSLPNIPTFTSLTQQIIEKRSAAQSKTYSGTRLRNDTLLMIYYYDSTIAVTELGPAKLLVSCELIEIYSDKEGEMLLKQLSEYNKPLKISFNEMMKLMSQCERVDKYTNSYLQKTSSSKEAIVSSNEPKSTAMNLAVRIFPRNPLSIWNGIIPGTKWCGTGDIAETYHDLGTEMTMDRCCRQHDLCPVKVRAYQKKYNLENDSLYTKSHCLCDDLLFSCLQATNTTASMLMGSVYFNVVQVPCLTGNAPDFQYRAAKKGF